MYNVTLTNKIHQLKHPSQLHREEGFVLKNVLLNGVSY